MALYFTGDKHSGECDICHKDALVHEVEDTSGGGVWDYCDACAKKEGVTDDGPDIPSSAFTSESVDRFFRRDSSVALKPAGIVEAFTEGADDSNERPEDYLERKFKDCNETTMSGAIAGVEMGFKDLDKDERTPVESVTRRYEAAYSPKTGKKCHCRPGIWRDNCPDCEGTGWEIDFAKIRAANGVKPCGCSNYSTCSAHKKDTPLPVESVHRIVRGLLAEEAREPNPRAYDTYGHEIAAHLCAGDSAQAVIEQAKDGMPLGVDIDWNKVEKIAHDYIEKSFVVQAQKAKAHDALYDVIDTLEKYKHPMNPAESRRPRRSRRMVEVSLPSKCPKCGNTSPEAVVFVPEDLDPDQIGVLVNKSNGTVTNRWGDGTAGVPAEVRAMADGEESAHCTSCGEEFNWQHESRRPRRRRMSEEIDQSVFDRLLHYKADIPNLIQTIEGIISAHNPADSDELFDELAEVVNLLAKADHTLAGLITSKNLRTPGAEPRAEEPETLETEPQAGAPMNRPDETRA